MKHNKKGRKFGRVRKVRVALMRSLARALVLNGKIETTVAKAKELRPFVEKLITLSKKDSVASRRLVESRMGNDKEVSQKLHTEIAPKYKDRQGGYTRIVKLGKRADASQDKAIIELI